MKRNTDFSPSYAKFTVINVDYCNDGFTDLDNT